MAKPFPVSWTLCLWWLFLFQQSRTLGLPNSRATGQESHTTVQHSLTTDQQSHARDHNSHTTFQHSPTANTLSPTTDEHSPSIDQDSPSTDQHSHSSNQQPVAVWHSDAVATVLQVYTDTVSMDRALHLQKLEALFRNYRAGGFEGGHERQASGLNLARPYIVTSRLVAHDRRSNEVEELRLRDGGGEVWPVNPRLKRVKRDEAGGLENDIRHQTHEGADDRDDAELFNELPLGDATILWNVPGK